eukprot:2279123-Rhodomonas_salina.1
MAEVLRCGVRYLVAISPTKVMVFALAKQSDFACGKPLESEPAWLGAWPLVGQRSRIATRVEGQRSRIATRVEGQRSRIGTRVEGRRQREHRRSTFPGILGGFVPLLSEKALAWGVGVTGIRVRGEG